MDFARTQAGHRFFERTLPDLVREAGRLADAVGRRAEATGRLADALGRAAGAADAADAPAGKTHVGPGGAP